MRTQRQFSISNMRCLDLTRVTRDSLAQIMDIHELETNSDLEQIIRWDVARVFSYFDNESSAPSSAQRAAALKKATTQVNRLHKHLTELEPDQYAKVDRALSRLEQPNLVDPSMCVYEVRRCIAQLLTPKYRLSMTKFDRALFACSNILFRLDDASDGDLFDGLHLSRPKSIPSPSAIETFAHCLAWISRAGKAILPTVSKSGLRWSTGIHTAVNHLAPRYEKLTGNRASYWGEKDDVPEQSFQNFVVSVLEASGLRLSLDHVRSAIRTYCEYRNRAEALQKTG